MPFPTRPQPLPRAPALALTSADQGWRQASQATEREGERPICPLGDKAGPGSARARQVRVSPLGNTQQAWPLPPPSPHLPQCLEHRLRGLRAQSCSWGFPRHEYWSGLPFPSPGNPPSQGTEPTSPAPPALQADSLPLSRQGSPLEHCLQLRPSLGPLTPSSAIPTPPRPS